MLNRVLRTTGFRIALAYLLLLGATLTGLGLFIGWTSSAVIERQLNETVEAEIRGLAEQYRDEGLQRLVGVLRERSGTRGDPQSIYLLVAPDLRHLAGNLDAWPSGWQGSDPDGWRELRLLREDAEGSSTHVVRGRAFVLGGGFRLFVGRDTAARDAFRTGLFEALAWALIPALLLGIVGGALIGRYGLNRVEAVRATSDEIVAGDLSRRVPLNGSGDEFDRLALTINKMLERIETLMTGMRMVTDSLAHDLRSPLTRAKSETELALRAPPDAERDRAVLERMAQELDTILKTFDSLIQIARTEAGMSGVGLSRLDLSELATELAEIYQPLAEDARLTLEAAVTPGLHIQGHRQLLAQAVINLIDNAMKFTPAGDTIRLSLVGSDGRVVLRLADSGPGIPEQDRARVLERFVRLDESRGTPGSGLGLSLVAAVAKLHGATLELGDAGPGLAVTLEFRGV